MTRLPPLTIVIDAPARDVWKILGPRFDHIGQWASSISHSTATDPPTGHEERPTERVCTSTVPGVAQVRERIEHYDPDAMTPTYLATDGLPRFVHCAANTWIVSATGARTCTVTTSAELDARDPIGRLGLRLARPALMRMGRHTLEDLKHHAEHGRPSPRKRRRTARAGAGAGAGAAVGQPTRPSDESRRLSSPRDD